MEEMITIQLLADKTLADEIGRKGLAEIALRRADSKFKAMVKCKLVDPGTVQKEVADKIASVSMDHSLFGKVDSMTEVRAALNSMGNNFGGRISALTKATRNMATKVDNIYHHTLKIQSLSYLNAGISLANIAVDIAGFIVIIDRLNRLNDEIQDVINRLDQIKNIKKNEKLSRCQELIMQFNSLAEKIGDSEEVDLDVIDALLIKLNAYISEMIYNLQDNTLETELILGIIDVILPAYTFLLKVYIERFYYKKKKLPPNYQICIKLYDELEEANFKKRLEDHYYEYYFVEKKMNIIDVLDLVNAQILLGLNGKVQIEDQVTLLQLLREEEKIKEFEQELESIVNEWAREELPSIAMESGADEKTCAQVLGLQ